MEDKLQSSSLPKWIAWAREIEAIAQTGMHFSSDDNQPEDGKIFDHQRYSRLLEISTEIFTSHTDIPKLKLLKNFLSERGYATPKIDVRAAIFESNHILLVQEKVDHCWSMPGGWADVNEVPSKMIEREILEESGLIAKAEKVVGIYDANHDREPLTVYHAYKIVYLCRQVDGSLRGSDETITARFFPIDQLPPFSGTRTDERHVKEAFQHSLDPGRPTYFE
jgi:ADP-ribose pyrophosphatase YjhB (NUDIX family)